MSAPSANLLLRSPIHYLSFPGHTNSYFFPSSGFVSSTRSFLLSLGCTVMLLATIPFKQASLSSATLVDIKVPAAFGEYIIGFARFLPNAMFRPVTTTPRELLNKSATTSKQFPCLGCKTLVTLVLIVSRFTIPFVPGENPIRLGALRKPQFS